MKKRRISHCLLLAGILFLPLMGCGLAQQGDTNGAIEIEAPQNFPEADVIPTDPVTFYGYDSLDEKLRKIYRQLLQGIEEYKDEVSVSPCTKEEVNKAFDMILVDHPEIFWLVHQSSVTYEQLEDGTILNMKLAFTYNMEKEEIDGVKQQMEATADQWLSQLPEDTDTYGKIKYVYDFLCRNVKYNIESSDNQNIRSVFENQSTVCMGYAKATQYLLNRLGIFCTLVTGQAGPQSEDHAWNLVKIGEQPYYVDTTWGAPGFMEESGLSAEVTYTYLCCDETTLFQTHIPDGAIPLPSCADDSYNYYKMEGSWYETYDEAVLYQVLVESIQNGASTEDFKFGTADSYNLAVQGLVNGDLIKRAVQDAYPLEAGETYQWNIGYSEEDRLITVYW